MRIENKEMLLYSMNRALEELQETLEQNRTDRKEIYYRLGTCLHWIIDCYDRLPKEFQEKDSAEWFDGIRGANNALKHERLLNQLEIPAGGKRYPYRYAYSYTVTYKFGELVETAKTIPKQERGYKKHIMGKVVLQVLKHTVDEVNRYYANYTERIEKVSE